jgi:hypothetical protein
VGRAAFLVAFLAVASFPDAAADEDPCVARLVEDLRAPFEAVREEALTRLAELGPAALDTGRALCVEAEPWARAAGAALLGRVGGPDDTAALLRGLGDQDLRVRNAAAEAVLALAERAVFEAGAEWSAAAEDPRARDPLARALEPRLEAALSGQVPDLVTDLGEPLVPALVRLLEEPSRTRAVRARAAQALGRLGTDAARAALAGALGRVTPADGPLSASLLLEALDDAGHGSAMAGVEAWVRGQLSTEREWRRSWRGGLGDRIALLHWLARHPPSEADAALRDALRGWIKLAARTPGAFPPWAIVDLLRAYCALGTPSDEDLVLMLRTARTRVVTERHRWREQLGEVLLVLEPYAEREALRAGLRELIRRADDEVYPLQLPRTVESWARWLVRADEPEETAAQAHALLLNEGAAASDAQRRLGAELWSRLEAPRPPAEVVRALLEEDGGSLKPYALRWAGAALGRAEAQAARADAVAEGDDAAALAAAAGWCGAPDDSALVLRLAALALRAPRATRERAFEALATLAGKDPAEAAAGSLPLAGRHAALARLRAALGDRARALLVAAAR